MRDVQSYAVIGLFVLAAGSALYVASELFLPIFLALFLCVILYPAVRTISAVGVPDWCGALLVVGGLVGATGLALFQLSDPAMYWLDELPEIVRILGAEAIHRGSLGSDRKAQGHGRQWRRWRR